METTILNIAMIVGATLAISRLVYTVYWIVTDKPHYFKDAAEWHPHSGLLRVRDSKTGEKLSSSMRRQRQDGTWEYRPMTTTERDNAWVEAQW